MSTQTANELPAHIVRMQDEANELISKISGAKGFIQKETKCAEEERKLSDRQFLLLMAQYQFMMQYYSTLMARIKTDIELNQFGYTVTPLTTCNMPLAINHVTTDSKHFAQCVVLDKEGSTGHAEMRVDCDGNLKVTVYPVDATEYMLNGTSLRSFVTESTNDDVVWTLY